MRPVVPRKRNTTVPLVGVPVKVWLTVWHPHRRMVGEGNDKT
jgi:hypothetical protein